MIPDTTTNTGPAAWPGTVVTIVSSETQAKDASMPPNVTDLASEKPLPVMVTLVPPEAGPPGGSTESTVGGSPPR